MKLTQSHLRQIIKEELQKVLKEEQDKVDLPANVINKIRAGDPLTVADYIASQNKSKNVNAAEVELLRDGLVAVHSVVWNKLASASDDNDEKAQTKAVLIAKTFINRLYQRDPSIKKKGYNPGIIGYGSGAYPRINRMIYDLDQAAREGYMLVGPAELNQPNPPETVGLGAPVRKYKKN